MAAIAKFVSYDGGIAFSNSVILIKKGGEDAPSCRIPLSDVSSLNVRRPVEDSEGFIRVTTADGQRYRVFFEDDQFRQAVQFKKRFDALLTELDDEDTTAAARASAPRERSGSGRRTNSTNSAHPMTAWKLVAGIISIVLSMFVLFQSCAAGLGNAIEGNNEVGGSAGVIVAVLLLAGGIASIAVRRGSRGGNIALVAMFTLAAVVGFVLAGSYTDLRVWAAWCLVNAMLAVISLIGSSQAARRGSPKAYVIAACAVAAIGAVAIVGSIAGGSKKAPSSASGAGVSVSQPVENAQSTQQTAPEQNGGPVQLGDYTVEIKDAYMATDHDGKSAIVINYAWTNNSESTTSAAVSFLESAFQDGIELEHSSLPDDAYDSWTEIRPGAALDVNAVFLLRSGSPVEFEIKELISFSDQAATKTFDLNSMS